MRNYYLIIDTETANGYMEGDKLNLQDSLVYDCGYAIIDKKGRVYESASYVVGEVFLNEIDMMNSAYYAEKIPQYWIDLHNRTRTFTNIFELRRNVRAICEKYNVKAIIAHNARFDVNALNNTIRYYSKSAVRYFFPYGIEIWDTLMMSNIIAHMPSYITFCETNGYMTKHKTPRPRLTAEIIYRYISGNEDFQEKHTGLEDVMIEKEIFAYCNRQHKKMKKVLYKGA